MPSSYRLSIACLTLLALVAQSAHATEYDLTPADLTGKSCQVVVELKVGGDLTIRDLNSQDPSSQDQAVRKLPMSVSGRLAYEEQRLDAKRCARLYDDAQATIKVDQGGKTPTLPADRRLMVAQQTNRRVVLCSPEGPLTREQLDLINVIGATPVLDQLMPGKKLGASESWQVREEVMRALLGLDTVSVCEVSNVVDEGNASFVKFQVAGAVHGEVDGAQTEFELRGLGLFDRKHACVTQLNLAVKEKRALGPATPGFTGVAKVNIKRSLVEKDSKMTDAHLAKARQAGAPQTALRLASDKLGFLLDHDRAWFLASESRSTMSLRRVDKSGLVAQATFTRLPSKSAANGPSLDQFEHDVRRALGKSLTELVSSEQWTNQAGCHCLGIVGRGRAEDLELEFRHWLVMPADGGHSVSITATLALNDMAAVANADRLLADSLELVSEERKAVASKESDRVEK